MPSDNSRRSLEASRRLKSAETPKTSVKKGHLAVARGRFRGSQERIPAAHLGAILGVQSEAKSSERQCEVRTSRSYRRAANGLTEKGQTKILSWGLVAIV